MNTSGTTFEDQNTASQIKQENKSNLTTILVATLVPAAVVLLVVAGVFVWLKNRRRGSGIPGHLSHIQRAFGSRDYGSSSNGAKIRHQKMENEHDTFELKVTNIVNESDIED